MLVQCTQNHLSSLSPEAFDHVARYSRRDPHEPLPIAPGDSFAVLGIVFRDNQPWYLIVEREDAQFPVPYHHGFFQVVSAKLPPGWALRPDRASVLPAEWVEDPSLPASAVKGEARGIASLRRVMAAVVDFHIAEAESRPRSWESVSTVLLDGDGT